jgi:hypothetical protein
MLEIILKILPSSIGLCSSDLLAKNSEFNSIGKFEIMKR